jgi:predicted 3-demethylubiquinone-9 3-methyltransferase (glyoxalase superfamily)/predicted enzyme related to lactoylglutathione lyase
MHRSKLAMVLVDVEAGGRDREVAFYSAALGDSGRQSEIFPEYSSFLGTSAPGFLVQEIGTHSRIHFDFHTDDLDAEVARLERLGATVKHRTHHWVVMDDPAGLTFCVVGVESDDASLVGASLVDGDTVTSQPTIATFLWFDGQVNEAVALYRSTFPGLIVEDDGGGSGFSATVLLNTQRIVLFNGGPMFPQTEAASISVSCATQEEIDRLWSALGESGGTPGRCGWLKDRFGVSWQIVPSELGQILGDPDPIRAGRAHAAMMEMGKLDVAALRAALNGESATS